MVILVVAAGIVLLIGFKKIASEPEAGQVSEIKIVAYKGGKDIAIDYKLRKTSYFQKLQKSIEEFLISSDDALYEAVSEETISKIKKGEAVEIIYGGARKVNINNPADSRKVIEIDRILIPLEGYYSPSAVFYGNKIYSYGPFINSQGESLIKSIKELIPVLESSQGGTLVILTDKTEYEHRDLVKIAVTNNLEKEVRVYIPLYGIEKFENGSWAQIKMVVGLCDSTGGSLPYENLNLYDVLEAGGTKEFQWDKKETWCAEPDSTKISDTASNEAMPGSYRVKSYVLNSNNVADRKTIYSNGFIIKEKPLISLCTEKNEGIGCCAKSWTGYEFDSSAGKCIEKKVSGCSSEILFETLEECQKICEAKEENFYSCDQDSDCIKVDGDCYGCSTGGAATAINKNFETEWRYYLDCKEMVCSQKTSNHPSCSKGPKCVDGKCVLK